MTRKNYLFDGHKLHYQVKRLDDFITKGDCYPLYMEISPVGSCNHRCVFCAYDFIGHPNRKLETGRYLELIDELSECGIKSLLYAGEGEPLLHPDIDRFVVHAKEKNIDVGMFTNGQLLKRELAEKILPSLTFMRFSFSGGSEENYARIHGVAAGTFEKVIQNIKAAVQIKEALKLDLDIGAQYVLLPENLPFLLEAVAQLKDAGVDYFAIKPFVQQSASQNYQMKEQLSLEVIGTILDKAEAFSDGHFNVIARRESFAEYGKRGYRHCYGTSFISVLNSAGDISSCLPYWEQDEFVYGNIYKNSFREIWHGEKRKKIKSYLENRLDTGSCPPNCRPHAINEYLYELKNPSIKHLNFI